MDWVPKRPAPGEWDAKHGEEEGEDSAAASSSHSPKRPKITRIFGQCLDFEVVYDPITLEERIAVLAKDEKDKAMRVDVYDIPHELFIAVGEGFTPRHASMIADELNTHLLESPHGCMVPGCVSCRSRADRPTYEPCLRQRKAHIQQAVVSHSLVRGRGFAGYEKLDRPFLKIVFSYAFFAKTARKWVESQSPAHFSNPNPIYAGIYDFVPNPVDSFILQRDFASFDWFSIPKLSKKLSDGRYLVKFSDLSPKQEPPEGCLIRTYTVMTVDIETIARKFINSESRKAKYPVGAIGTSVKRSNGERIRKTFMFGPPIEGSDHIVVYPTELEMFRAFHRFILDEDPDAFLGFNSNKFDWPYLLRRAEVLKFADFPKISRIPEYQLTYQERQTQSGQKGTQIIGIIDCPGRIFLDLYIHCRNSMKLDKYGLGDVSKEVLKTETKDDLKYDQLYDHFYGTMEQRKRLGDYCGQDVNVTWKIEEKVGLFRRLRAKCKILRLRSKEIMERGLSYMLMMLTRLKLRAKGYHLAPIRSAYNEKKGGRQNIIDPALEEVDGYEELWDMKMMNEKYSGAYVFDPIIGIQWDAVFTFDFASLYPNIMRTKNICRSTLLPSVDTLPESECNISPAGFAFVREENKRGVLPEIEDELVDARNRVKDLLALATDADIKAMYEAEQLEIKVAANSLYGLLGTVTSEISLLAGALSITSWGASLIRIVAAAVKREFPDVEQIYGDTDSIMFRIIGCRDLERAREYGEQINNWINGVIVGKNGKKSGLLSGTLKMEFEDVSMPSLFPKKKAYVKIKYSPKKGDKSPPKVKKSGLESRSYTKYVVQAFEEIIQAGLIRQEPSSAIEALMKKYIGDLYAGNVTDRLLLKRSCNISQPLDQYEQECDQTVVAKQMLYDNLPVEPGDRVEYYMCEVQNTGKVSDLAVSAHIADKYQLKWDWYVRQLVSAFQAVLFPLVSCDIAHLADPKSYTTVDCMPLPRPPTTRIEDTMFGRYVVKRPSPPASSSSSAAAAAAEVEENVHKRHQIQDKLDDLAKKAEVKLRGGMHQNLIVPDLPPPVVPKRPKNTKDKRRLEKKTYSSMTKFFGVPEPAAGASAGAAAAAPGAKKPMPPGAKRPMPPGARPRGS